MIIDIFIKSYLKDMPFLAYCLRSIRQRLTGFRDILLVVPAQDETAFRTMPDYGQKLLTVPETSKDFREGYLFQQVCKLKADDHSDAPLFCFIDSDCVITHRCDLSELFREGKPIIVCRKWDRADKAIKWQKPTQDVMGFACPYETMCRHPAIHFRETLQAIRQHISLAHGTAWEQYLMSLQEFSEFNLLGTFAWHLYADLYYWMDVDKDDVPAPILMQFFSHHGITPEIHQQLKRLLP